MDDIQDLFKETIAEFMENGLEIERDATIVDRKQEAAEPWPCRFLFMHRAQPEAIST